MKWLIDTFLTIVFVIVFILGLFYDARTTSMSILLVIVGGVVGAIIQIKKK